MTLVKVNNPITKTFDGLLNDLFNEMPSLDKNLREEAFGFPPVNITEAVGAYHIEVAAPGMEKTDFNLKLDGNLLTISAEKKQETKDENAKAIRREFNYRSFKRSFTLDEKINAANIAAKYENGVLKVELPKKEEVKAVAKEITIA
ncbi:MAG: Hsp20/alpha crystallin family protein [Chitinophagaceae bacterium]|nr:Hsp20/alpha crystallin family protein [Chitinophagaceae bacterium]